MQQVNCMKYFFYFILLIKFFLFLILIYIINFGGADANTYNEMAYHDGSYYWGHFLYILNQYGVYDRTFLKFSLFVISSIAVPFLIAKITTKNTNIFWLIVILSSLYPTLLIFSSDIYRDVVMLFLFLIEIYLLKKFFKINKKSYFDSLKKSFLYAVIIYFAFFLCMWREYLGFSILVTILFYKVLDLKFINIKIFFIFYFLMLIFFYKYGFLNHLLEYRNIFLLNKANTTLKIVLYQKDLFDFLYLYIKSVMYELFGLFFVNFGAIIFFVFETIPFIFALRYIYKNKNMLSIYEKSLLLFCVIYGTIWLLGNDNLGTAIRLRIFNYVAIYLVFFSLINKQKFDTIKPFYVIVFMKELFFDKKSV